MLEKLLNTKWYSLVGIAGGFLFFYAFISKEVYFDRSATAFLGTAMVMFGCARNECTVEKSRFVDASELPSGMGSGLITATVHDVSLLGGGLYALSTLCFLTASLLFIV